MNETPLPIPLPTPRTDEAEAAYEAWALKEVFTLSATAPPVEPFDLARQLEREFSAATARIASMEELLREIRDGEVNPECEADKFLRDHQPSELSTARARIAELEGALNGVLKSAHPNQMDNPAMFAAWEAAREALNPGGVS